MFHSVIIATKGRPLILNETLASLAAQDRPPDEIIISGTDEGDVEAVIKADHMQVLTGPSGLCVQRNAGIRALNPRAELVTFLDDDVELSPDYCCHLRRFMDMHSDVSGVGGRVVLDGCTRQESRLTLQQAERSSQAAVSASSLYGCNMSFRRSAITDEWFDERLSLYAWLEDYDFSVRILKKGRLIFIPEMTLCHLRSTTGRISHARFGFAQIMNPWYLAGKGVIDRSTLWKTHVLRVVMANLIHLPADTANRTQRLRGNLCALALIVCGKIQPEAVNRIDCHNN